jgi:hypothetical protein
MAFGLKEMIQEARSSVEEVSVQDAHEGLESEAVHMLIDVPEPFEWDSRRSGGWAFEGGGAARRA